jgi:hypothetical protein
MSVQPVSRPLVWRCSELRDGRAQCDRLRHSAKFRASPIENLLVSHPGEAGLFLTMINVG